MVHFTMENCENGKSEIPRARPEKDADGFPKREPRGSAEPGEAADSGLESFSEEVASG